MLAKEHRAVHATTVCCKVCPKPAPNPNFCCDQCSNEMCLWAQIRQNMQPGSLETNADNLTLNFFVLHISHGHSLLL